MIHPIINIFIHNFGGNFTKFIIDRKGDVVARFEPTADMADVEKYIENLI